MKEAWASSVWSWSSWWWSWSYGAERAIYGTLWLSRWLGWGSSKKNEVVTWEAFTLRYELVEAMHIFWRFAPG